MMKEQAKRQWDIFCAVVDNYGDIGVCWRLARQLVIDHGLSVRLWLDDLQPLAYLCPETRTAVAQQFVQGVEVCHWSHHFPDVTPASVVIEAFACELPQNYLLAMAAQPESPLWINLEYLSAEEWVEGCHRMTSPHPRLPLTKHFFFPGFTVKTGGLLREADYDQCRARFDPTAFRTSLGLPEVDSEAITISLFGYENQGLPSLLNAWAGNDRPVQCLLPEGRLLPQVREFFGQAGQKEGRHFALGHLSVYVLPFLPQADYDQLLWLSDLNFVRGEDSFVRAQWAAKPLVWHIYPQEDLHHRVKLLAFLDHYLNSLAPDAALALTDFWSAWESQTDVGSVWPGLQKVLPVLNRHAEHWANHLVLQPGLSASLVSFAMESR